jgi:ABC-type antimicrobial peptide transport system permease subunit
MFTNFFKTAVRNLSKNKFFTVLNVFGLALGMSLSLLYIALLFFLNRFDDFHTGKERIYRVTSQVYDKHDNPRYASSPADLAQKLNDFSGVEKVVRINRSLNGEAAYGESKIEINGYFADPDFFETFNFPFLKGNKVTAIASPNTIVISENEAKKIFGSKEPMGKILEMEGYGSFLVTGVFRNLPENTHFEFDAIASYSTLISHQKNADSTDSEEEWKSFRGSYVYFRLHKDAKLDNIERYLNQIAKDKYAKQDIKASFKLQPLNKIVPSRELYDQIGPNWDYLGLFIIGLMTLIVLIPACSNYINLSISQSLERMREIGVRKVMGGRKKQIIFQFIVESTTIVLVALLFSFLFSEVIRKELLNQMVETSPIDLEPRWETFIGFLLFALLIGVATGFVPALYFSKISAISALKGKELKTSGRSILRKIVLTTQFIISLGFIMAVVIMMRQYHYSVNYDLGFDQKNLLDVNLQNVDQQRFKNEFAKLPSVKSISMSSHVLGTGSAANRFVKTANQLDSMAVSSMSVDGNFISNIKLDLVAGRNFSNNKLENSRLIIVNEVFVKRLNLKDPFAALDKSIVLTDSSVYSIIGVLKNFHYSGLKEAIQPFFFEYDPDKFRYANLKLASGDAVGSLGAMGDLWKEVGGEGKFTAHLFSDEIKDAYSFYKMIMKLWGFLGLLAITVACLGLLGTVSFTIKRRIKEISIRKVMGASAENLVVLLSKDFIKLMLIASIITIPVIFLVFGSLLPQLQHYNIQIGAIEVIASLMIMMLFGLTTVLSQTLKAANANPADNLRTE